MADGRRIVVGVDGSDSSRRALEWATGEALLRGATLEAVIAWHRPPEMSYPAVPIDNDFEGDARQALANELDAMLGPGAQGVVRRVEPGSAAPVLIEASRGADLLVVGSRGHGAFTGMLLGSVSRHCTAHAHCPVVVVRGDDGSVVEPRRIVVGVDGSASSRHALAWAAEEATLRGAAVEARIAWPQSSYADVPESPLDFEGIARETLDAELRAVVGPEAEDVARRVEYGPAAHLLTEASRGADLLVVGSSGHGAFAGMLLGSVSRHCTAHARCPVVVVRDGEDEHVP
ncbi:MAG TPA: universal stress protein [Acidimicrobiales bacterium]|nr:universal stress protein [Acidimicrobiales bacterium]